MFDSLQAEQAQQPLGSATHRQNSSMHTQERIKEVETADPTRSMNQRRGGDIIVSGQEAMVLNPYRGIANIGESGGGGSSHTNLRGMYVGQETRAGEGYESQLALNIGIDTVVGQGYTKLGAQMLD